MGQGRFSTVAGLAALCLLSSCATEPARKPAPELDRAQQIALAAAEKLYRAGDPAFAENRDRLAADPATAYWLTRLFVHYLLDAYDQQRASDTTFLATVASAENPVLARAKDQLLVLGAAAAPALIEDLLNGSHSDRRHLGVLLLVELGPSVLPHVTPLLDSSDWRLRLAAVQVAAPMKPGPEVIAVLERGAEDSSFAVRAEALGALLANGEPHVDRVRRALTEDHDPFVRRSVAAQLGDHGDPETAVALVSYLSDCLQRVDVRGARAAEASLIKISGHPKSGDLAFWRAWLATYASVGRR